MSAAANGACPESIFGPGSLATYLRGISGCLPKGPREDKHPETVAQYTERMNAFVGALTEAKTLALKAKKAAFEAAVKVASEAARKAEEAALEAARKAALEAKEAALEAARKAALEAALEAEEAAARKAAREAERAAALEAARAAEEEELRTSKKARVPEKARDAVFWAQKVLDASAHVLVAASTRKSDPDNTSHKKPVGLVALSSLDEPECVR
jgi:hypothetical protein